MKQEYYGQTLKKDVVPVPVVVPAGVWKVVVEAPPKEGVVVAVPVESPVGLREVVVDVPLCP